MGVRKQPSYQKEVNNCVWKGLLIRLKHACGFKDTSSLWQTVECRTLKTLPAVGFKYVYLTNSSHNYCCHNDAYRHSMLVSNLDWRFFLMVIFYAKRH